MPIILHNNDYKDSPLYDFVVVILNQFLTLSRQYNNAFCSVYQLISTFLRKLSWISCKSKQYWVHKLVSETTLDDLVVYIQGVNGCMNYLYTNLTQVQTKQSAKLTVNP